MPKNVTYKEIPFLENELYHTIGDRFQKVLNALPAGHPAYVDGQNQVTYQELFNASKALAARLQRAIPQEGAHQQQLVGLLLDPDWREMQCLVGISLSGHYYLALDSALNEIQWQKIMDDYPFRALITTTKYREIAARLTKNRPECDQIYLDELSGGEGEFEIPSLGQRSYQSLCLSSGSTGQPRSVIRTHGAGLISSYNAATLMHLNPSDRITLTSSIAMGMSTTPSIGALLTGATIYRRMDAMISPSAFHDWLRADQITIARASAGLLRSLTKLPKDFPPLEDLRLIDTGGEAFTREEIDGLLALMPRGGTFNVRLASNEAGNYALFTVHAGDIWYGEKNPAGYPPPFINVSIVDEARNALPPGEVGEITVRSKFLAAGYFNDPEGTKARFIPDPDDNEEFIYYTGDMGKISSDGLVEFFGRKDFRVKVRGYTIELEAVDFAISKIAGIAAATTAVQVLPSGNKRLIGYYVEKDGTELSPADLRQSLKLALPHYMVPSVLLKMDSLPKTPSGKIDRKALPLPPITRPDLKTPFSEPGTELEAAIAHIWEKILEVSPIGVNDNFFELGGDSLMSMQMIMEVELVCDCTITEEIFKLPTIANLSRFINAQANISDEIDSTAGPEWEQLRRGNNDRKRSIRKLVLKILQPRDIWQTLVLRLRKPFFTKFLRMGYADGLEWLMTKVQNPLFQDLFYRREKQIYMRFLESLGLTPRNDQKGFSQALAGSIWADAAPKIEHKGGVRFKDSQYRFWRDLAGRIEIVQPDREDPFIHVSGFDHLQDAYRSGRGVILLSYHGNVTKLPAVLIQKWVGLPSIPVISPRLGLRREKGTSQKNLSRENIDLGHPAEQARYGANAMLVGYRLLNEGKIVRVYIDNGFSSRGKWPIDVCGKQYMMRSGWADLAFHTRALVIATICALEKDGSIHLIFLPPFQLDDHDYNGQMQQFLAQYADFLSYAYRTFPWSFRWKLMQNHFNTPNVSK